jgi:hypothetical protein
MPCATGGAVESNEERIAHARLQVAALSVGARHVPRNPGMVSPIVQATVKSFPVYLPAPKYASTLEEHGDRHGNPQYQASPRRPLRAPQGARGRSAPRVGLTEAVGLSREAPVDFLAQRGALLTTGADAQHDDHEPARNLAGWPGDC